MTRMGLLCAGIFCFTGLLCAQETANNPKPHEMSGTICNASCVTKADNLSTCDTSCTDKSGVSVLVDDQGNVKQIANQSMAKPHEGERMKMMVVPTEKEREQEVRIVDIEKSTP